MHVCWLPWTKWTHHKKPITFALDLKIVGPIEYAKIYTKIDLHGVYNLVRIHEGDE